MDKILIIGKRSFLGSNLKKYLSKKFKIDNFSFENISKKKISYFDKYSHIINTTIHPNYVKHKYNVKYDLDKLFIRKFKKIKFYYIFLNTRKIYSPGSNLNENSKINPLDNYAKNKFITEQYLKKNIRKKFVSLRISNVIGKRIFKYSRNSHKLFFDNFLCYKKNFFKNKKKIITPNDFKDFLSIEQFCNIISKIIKSKIYGVYNVSISEKIFISEIIYWIDKSFLKNINFTEEKKNSFTLSNKKLIKKIKIKITKNQLKRFCKKLI